MFVQGTDKRFEDIHGANNLDDTTTGSSHLSELPREYLRNDSDASRAHSMFGNPARAKEIADNLRGGGLALAGRQATNAQMNPDVLAARNGQIAAMGNYMNQIRGTGPSMAPTVMRRGMDQAGARGSMATAMAAPGNMAGAQRMAMLGVGGGANASAVAGAGTRAGEVANAYQGYMGGTAQLVGDDIGAAQRQSSLEMGNRAYGDKMRAGYEDMALGLEETQMRGQHGRLSGLVNAQDNYMKAYQGRLADRNAQNAQELNQVLGFGGATVSAGGTLL